MITLAIAQIVLATQQPVDAPFEFNQVELVGVAARVNADLILTMEPSLVTGRKGIHVHDSRGQFIETLENFTFAEQEGAIQVLTSTAGGSGQRMILQSLGSRSEIVGFPILGGGEIVRDDWKGNQINPLLHHYLQNPDNTIRLIEQSTIMGNLAFSNKVGDLRVIHGNKVTPLELPEGFEFTDKLDVLQIYWAQEDVILGRISGTVPSGSEPGSREPFSQNVRWVDGKLVDLPDPEDSEFEGEQEVTTKYGHFMNAAGDIAGLTVLSRPSAQQPRKAYFTVWKKDEIALIPLTQNLILTGITGDGSLTGYTVINDISRPFININNEWHDVFEAAGIDADHGRIFPFHSLPQALVTWSKDRVSYTAILKINQPSAPSDTADR